MRYPVRGLDHWVHFRAPCRDNKVDGSPQHQRAGIAGWGRGAPFPFKSIRAHRFNAALVAAVFIFGLNDVLPGALLSVASGAALTYLTTAR